MTERKIAAMHRLFGTKEHLCRDCDHLIGGKYHNKQYYKCELYCRKYVHVCECAASNGDCMLTECAKYPSEPYSTTTLVVKYPTIVITIPIKEDE